MCLEKNQFDPAQSSFTENEYLGYFEVKASDIESIKKYYETAFPLRPMPLKSGLAQIGERLDGTACFVGKKVGFQCDNPFYSREPDELDQREYQWCVDKTFHKPVGHKQAKNA